MVTERPHQEPDVSEVEDADDEPEIDATDGAEAAAVAQKELDDLVEAGKVRLTTVEKIGALADLREEIEQELPPESAQLKTWNSLCDEKQRAILDATRRPKR